MSLQVWLPLNGNLNNQGLSDVTVTNNGATVDSNGKIGSCYSFNGSSYIKVSLPSAFTTIKNTSIAAWVYSKSSVLALGGISYDGNNRDKAGCTLYTSGWQFINSSAYKYLNAGTIANTSVWKHVAVTVAEDTITTYLNGAVVTTGSLTSLGALTTLSSDNFIEIGCDHPGVDECLTGYVNDFRVYDHCLSAKEVKEISKGLICHYKLDNNGFGNPNLLITQSPSSFSRQGNKYINTAADTRTNDTFDLQYYRGSTYVTTFFGKDVSVTPCDVKITFTVPENVTGIRVKFNGESRDLELFTPSRAPVVAGETYTLSLRVLSSKSEVVGGVQVENPKLEKGSVATSWCPHTSDSVYTLLGPDSATEADCSGYRYNGTKIGGLSSSTSPVSIRYESCYDFDGSTGSIQIPSLSTLVPSGEFTMNCWIYHDNTWSSEGYETIFGGPSGFELDAKHGATNSPVLYACDWGKGRTTYELNKWNMITMTRNTSETKFYVNGELKITGSAGSIPPGSYFVGAWKTSNEQNYKGKISDFRLYSTVLSTEDIKTLYNTSASIDKNGNMYAYEFKEE